MSTPAPAASAAAPAASADDQARQKEFEGLLEIDEPGAQERGLEAFVAKYPHAPELPDVYDALIKDAAALADSRRELEFNIKLQQLDPADIGQRIKTLNLLLLETDPDSRALAAQYARDLSLAVDAKEHESASGDPDMVNPAEYKADLNRMHALAALFQGSAAQALGHYAEAENDLQLSLKYEQSEQAAEHLGQVELAEAKLPEALDAFTLALALPGQSIAERAALRAQAGDLYKRLHPDGAPPSLGDRILSQFDAVAARDAAEAKALSPDPGGWNRLARTPADFTLLGLDGARHRLSDLFAKNQVVVVTFWSLQGGVPASVASLRDQLAATHGVAFLAINEDPGPGSPDARIAPVTAYRAGHAALGAASDNWLDAGLADYLGVGTLPAVVVFDREGVMVYRREGVDTGSDSGGAAGFPADLASAVTTALTGDAQ